LIFGDKNHIKKYSIVLHSPRKLLVVSMLANKPNMAANSLDQFEFLRNIGKGSYGEVTLAKHKRDRKQVYPTFNVH